MPARRPNLLALAMLSQLAACRQLVGIDEGAVDGGGPAPVVACGLALAGATQTCGECLAMRCCQQAERCANFERCPALDSCLVGCRSGDASCRLSCTSASLAFGTFSALDACRTISCAAERL